MKKITLFLIGLALSFNAISQQFKWADVFSGPYGLQVQAHTTDNDGNSYIVAFFHTEDVAVDIDPGAGVEEIESEDGAFVFAKYNTSGSLVWFKQAAPPGENYLSLPKLVFDPYTEDIVIVANNLVNNTDVDFSSGVTEVYSETGGDLLIARYASSDGDFISVKRIESTTNFLTDNIVYAGIIIRGPMVSESYSPVVIDENGNMTITGVFAGRAHFDINDLTPSSSWNKNAVGGLYPFLVKYDSDGEIIYFEQVASGWGDVFGVANDNNNYTYALSRVSDQKYGSDFVSALHPNTITLRKIGTGMTPIWTKNISVSEVLLNDLDEFGSVANNIAIDEANNVYISGYFTGTVDFDPGTAASSLTSEDGLNSFIAKYDEDGDFIWAKKVGIADIHFMRTNGNNKIVTFSSFYEEDMDFGSGTTDTTGVMLTIHDTSGNLLTARRMDDSLTYYGMNTRDNDIFFYGTINTNADYDLISPLGAAAPVPQELASVGLPPGGFVVKYDDCIPNNTVLIDSICEGGTYAFGGSLINGAGVYSYDLASATASCDSTIILNLSTFTLVGSQTAEICAGTSYLFGTSTLTTAGTYSHVFTSSAGCDSTVTLTLSVNSVDVSVSELSGQLKANVSGATYQWINCDGNIVITGATSQLFAPASTGEYKVAITIDGCTDTSSCRSFDLPTSVEQVELNSQAMKIYPNPASNEVVLEFLENNVYSSLNLVDVSGRVLSTVNIDHLQKINLDIRQIPSGIYFLQLVGKERVGRLKFVKN